MKSRITPSRITPSLFGLALALGGSSAMAQGDSSVAALQVRGFASIGVVGGGDKLSTFDVEIGRTTTTENVRAGGSTDIRGGVELVVHPRWSVQFSAGYVTDGVRADNGKVTFTAYPVEALAHFAIHPAWRIGAGVRAPLGAKYEEGGAGGRTNTRFSSRVSPVVEGEWLITPHIGVKLRGMRETYRVKGSGLRIDGSNVGLSGAYYFF